MNKSRVNYKGILPYMVVSLLFFFIVFVENDLYQIGNINWNLRYILEKFFISFGSTFLLSGFVVGILYAGRRYAKISLPTFNGEKVSFSRSTFLYATLFFVLLWLPFWLAFYPGICAYDSYVQVEQIVYQMYNEHHPLLHTLIIRLFMYLGQAVFKTPTHGIGVYSLLQMALLSATCANIVYVFDALLAGYSISKRKHRIVLIAFSLFIAIYPFNGYMSVSVTKDIPFTICFVNMLCSAIAFQISKNSKTMRYYVLFCLTVVGVIAFRNNGKYAIVFMIAFMITGAAKSRAIRKLLAGALASLILGIILLLLLSKTLVAQQADRREMLSIPIQQLARTMIYHGGVGILTSDDNTLSDQDKSIIDDFLLCESYKLYNPYIADPVKRNTNTSVVLRRRNEFISTYVRLLMRYPDEYINAFLANNAGILSPADVSHAEINLADDLTGLGYVQTRWSEDFLNECRIEKRSAFKSGYAYLEQWASDNKYLNIPAVTFVLRPGIFLWIYLLLSINVIKHRETDLLYLISLVAGYYVTMFFGPTVQLRYVYPVMLALPVLIFVVICFSSAKMNKEGE